MKSETIDESKYPMTYEEFEKRVSELFLEAASSPKDLEFRKYLLKEEKEDGMLRREYEYACYHYDNPESPDNEFTDEGLLMQPVRILEMI